MKLSVILVNYNSKQLTRNCIQSVLDKTKSLDYEIIFIDNNSSDGSADFIIKEFPNIKTLRNKENKGFAYANNQALAIATGKYVILLNNDTVLRNNALKKMVDFMDNNPIAGAVTCKLLESDEKTIQRNCRSFPTPMGTMFGRASILTKLFPNNPWSSKNLLTNWDYNSIREIDWASGAALMVRRAVVDRVGLLDSKNFFIYWEDTDWCKRIRASGWSIFFVPEAEIIHFTGRGGGRRNILLSNWMIYQMHRSAYKYFWKHYLKSWLSPVTIITFLGFVFLTIMKIAFNTIKMLIK